MTMKARIEATRALAYYVAAALDHSKREPETQARGRAQATLDFLTPVVKAWCTDIGFEVASTGIQVHGGMGYIEETGAAQILRDVRISSIYEGTNGIQARDLVGRKLVPRGRRGGPRAHRRDGGAGWRLGRGARRRICRHPAGARSRRARAR